MNPRVLELAGDVRPRLMGDFEMSKAEALRQLLAAHRREEARARLEQMRKRARASRWASLYAAIGWLRWLRLGGAR